MTLAELKAACRVVQLSGCTNITLVVPKVPRGFPRGELLCDNGGKRVWSFPVDKMLAMVRRLEKES